MAQIFDRGLILAIKLSALVGVVVMITLLFAWRWSIDYPHAQAAPVNQPIPFSHQHHVRDDGIDCRYCHTSVEVSANAGLPASEICMTCHSQLFRNVALFKPLEESLQSGRRLQWNRVNDLPDFVFFDHSAHVTHGVSCNQCHGRVDQLPLMSRAHSLEMQWCLDCHRNPSSHLVPAAHVFDMQSQPPTSKREQAAVAAHYNLLSQRWMTDCSTCHR